MADAAQTLEGRLAVAGVRGLEGLVTEKRGVFGHGRSLFAGGPCDGPPDLEEATADNTMKLPGGIRGDVAPRNDLLFDRVHEHSAVAGTRGQRLYDREFLG